MCEALAAIRVTTKRPLLGKFIVFGLNGHLSYVYSSFIPFQLYFQHIELSKLRITYAATGSIPWYDRWEEINRQLTTNSSQSKVASRSIPNQCVKSTLEHTHTGNTHSHTHSTCIYFVHLFNLVILFLLMLRSFLWFLFVFMEREFQRTVLLVMFNVVSNNDIVIVIVTEVIKINYDNLLMRNRVHTNDIFFLNSDEK